MEEWRGQRWPPHRVAELRGTKMTDIPRLEAVKEAPDTTHRHTVGESMASFPIHNCAGPRARARSLVRKKMQFAPGA